MKFAFLCNKPSYSMSKKVAIIGAGPAGLFVAGYLACRGYLIDIYDKQPLPGGLMVFAIPRTRVNVEDVLEGCRELEEKFNVKFYLKTKIVDGKNIVDEGDEFVENIIKLSDLIAKYDAVVIATGTWRSRRLGIPGENSKNVYTALGFLYKLRVNELGSKQSPSDNLGKVLIIGAGLSAVDVAEECLHKGAQEVYMVYRRTVKEAPAGIYRIKSLIKKGVKFIELAQPKKFITEGDVVKAVEFTKVRLGEPDETGRPRPIPIPGSEFTIEADTIVLAVGEIPTPPISEEPLIRYISSDGRLAIDFDFRIPKTNIFACGDVVTGPSKIGLAVSNALKVAREIDRFLSRERASIEDIISRQPKAKITLRLAKWSSDVAKSICSFLNINNNINIDTCLGLAPFIRVFDYDRCISCETCNAVCSFIHDGKSLIEICKTTEGLAFPKSCMHCANPKCTSICRRNAFVKGELEEILIDYSKCNNCLDCIKVCPIEAIKISRGRAIKCDLCISLRERGLLPACMATCPANAITILTLKA